jgi:flagellum-specific ATP synthase
MRAAETATAIAEGFRDEGKDVLFLMDSVTRYATAAREVGLASGEPPVMRGFPPSVFSLLPKLLERTGNGARGSITAFYAVLVEGGDFDEPVSDAVRSIVDGHVILSRRIAERNHWPAIDVPASLSRVMPAVTDIDHREAAGSVRSMIAAYEEARDLIEVGAYARGSNPLVDLAIDRRLEIEAFTAQRLEDRAEPAVTIAALAEIARPAASVSTSSDAEMASLV